ATAHEGGLVTYTFTIRNTGDVPLVNVTVIDDVLGNIGTIVALPAGATTVLTKTMTVPTGSTVVNNEVTACGLDPLAASQLCDTAIHHLDVLHPAITLDKKVAGADHKPVSDALITHAGEKHPYTIVITNTGDTPLVITDLTDTIDGVVPGSCSQGLGSTLAVGGVMTCSYTAADNAHNVAAVTAVDALGGPKGTVTASDETFTRLVHPAITIVKSANPISVEPGQDVTYTYVVTNTGDTVLTDVIVTDDMLGTIATIAKLGVGESKSVSKTV